MTYRCIDVETTSLPKDGEPSGLMEIGYCDLRFGIIHSPVSALVDCGIPVSIESRAVHHISDEMVAGEIGPSEACQIIASGDHEYTCAHNTDFEKNFVGAGVKADGEERKWICTYKTALRIWPDAPGHKLMELRYFLKLDDAEDFDPKCAEPTHRAGADAYVCAHLLRRILAEPKITVKQLVRWSSGPALLYMCWMKKHKGKPWRQVVIDDRPYMEWIIEKSDVQDRDIRATIKYWLKHTARPEPDSEPYDR